MAGNSIYLPKKNLWEGGLSYPGAFLTGSGAKSFTVPEHVGKVYISMAAGGGGGGCGLNAPLSQGGGAGGSGGEVISFWYEVPANRVLNFTIGAGGAGQTIWIENGRGAIGQDTTFTNLNLVARGGQGGSSATYDGDGIATKAGGAALTYTNLGGSGPGGNAIGTFDTDASGTHGDPAYDGDPGFGTGHAAGGPGGTGAADCFGAGGGGGSIGVGGTGGRSTNINFHPSLPALNGGSGIHGGGGGGGGGNGGSFNTGFGTGGAGGAGAVLIEWIGNERYY